MFFFGLLVGVHHQFTFARFHTLMVVDMDILVSWICCHVAWLVSYLCIRGTSYLLLQD